MHSLLLETSLIFPDVDGHSMNALQHDIPQHILQDVMPGAFAMSIFVCRAYVVILFSLEAIAGGKVHPLSAFCAEGNTGAVRGKVILQRTCPVLPAGCFYDAPSATPAPCPTVSSV